jgi:hypothetical protein
MKMSCVNIVMGNAPRIKKETSGSGAVSVSCNVMKTVHLVTTTMLHLSAIFCPDG